jgi:hypothetical protein
MLRRTLSRGDLGAWWRKARRRAGIPARGGHSTHEWPRTSHPLFDDCAKTRRHHRGSPGGYSPLNKTPIATQLKEAQHLPPGHCLYPATPSMTLPLRVLK